MVGGVAQDRVDYSNKQRLNQPPIKIKNTKKLLTFPKSYDIINISNDKAKSLKLLRCYICLIG